MRDPTLSEGPTPDDFRAKVFRDREHIGDWRVEKLLDDGESSEIAVFSGGDARQRAIRYADREYGAFDEIELEPYNYFSEDQIAAEPWGDLKTDWRRLRSMTDDETHAAIIDDPDATPTDEAFWESARVVKPSG